MAVAHFAFDFSARNEGGDGVDDQNVDCIGAHEGVDDLESLFAGVGLRHDEIVDIDTELASIDRIESMFSVDERGGTAGGLGCGDRMKGQGRLTRAFGSIDFDDAAARHAADTKCDVEAE